MTETAATIKQLSEELHVSEQALRQWCKRNEIQKTTKGKVTSYFLSENDVELIRKHYTTQRKQNHNESESSAQRKESKYLSLLGENEELKKQLADKSHKLESLIEQQKSIPALKAEIDSRDKLIIELQADKKLLNKRLDKAEAERTSFLNNISELTIALKAAQALHGMDKQQVAIEVKPDAEPEQTEQPRKTSFFSRLFRRK